MRAKKLNMKKSHVQLTSKDKEQLQSMLKKSSLTSRTYKRITALLELDKGNTYTDVSDNVLMSSQSLSNLAQRRIGAKDITIVLPQVKQKVYDFSYTPQNQKKRPMLTISMASSVRILRL